MASCMGLQLQTRTQGCQQIVLILKLQPKVGWNATPGLIKQQPNRLKEPPNNLPPNHPQSI